MYQNLKCIVLSQEIPILNILDKYKKYLKDINHHTFYNRKE